MPGLGLQPDTASLRVLPCPLAVFPWLAALLQWHRGASPSPAPGWADSVDTHPLVTLEGSAVVTVGSAVVTVGVVADTAVAIVNVTRRVVALHTLNFGLTS
jgi:hypothetical protein